MSTTRMRAAVIGCGAGGIVCAAHLLRDDSGFSVDVFERSDAIGGTWVYTEEERDRHGLPVHTSMYKGLRTNLPKEVMEFSGFHYKGKENISYISAQDVIDYLNKYVDHHDIRKHVKFEHLVKSVKPMENNWELVVSDLNSNTDRVSEYDAVFVCNGHYSVPSVPQIKGADLFEGIQMHSHYYRAPEAFRAKRVLIIGIGPSGQDISYCVSPHATKIFLSHHSSEFGSHKFPDNVVFKPDVTSFDEHSATFQDGSIQAVDAVIYCTGYFYSFPFLDESCGIEVCENYVKPLYKQLISIPHPTMCFIGLPVRTFIFPLLEVQAKCMIRILSGRAELPSRAEMTRETLDFEGRQRARGAPLKDNHVLGLGVKDYIAELTGLCGSEPLPEVLFGIFARSAQRRDADLENYRDEVFHVVDSERFWSEPVVAP